MKNYLKPITLSFLTIILFTGCAAPKVKQNITMPANVPGMTDVKKLAVNEFKNDKNRVLTQDIEAFFSNITVKGQPYFEVVDREALDIVKNERKSSPQTNNYETDNIGLGKKAGVDAIIYGTKQDGIVEQTSYKENRRGNCIRKKGNKCKEYATIKISCIKQTANAGFSLKAVNISQAKVIHNQNYTGNSENKYCPDRGDKKHHSYLIGKATNAAINKIRKDVAPYESQISISLLDEDDSALEEKESAHEYFESGLEFSKSGRMDRGCEQFQKVLEMYKDSPAVYYNLGVCAEIKSDWNKASQLYNKADKLTMKPMREINTALTRIQQRVAQQTILKEQLR